MGAGFDFVVERTAPDNAADVASTIPIFTYRLAAITGDQFLRLEAKTVIGVPTLSAMVAVIICEQVIFIRWALRTIGPTL